MYRRLAIMSVRLEEYGLLHEKNYGVMLRRLAGPMGSDEQAVANIKTLVDIIEPVKGYKRGTMQNATQQTPLTRLVDAARPDSAKAREFARMIESWLYADTNFDKSVDALSVAVQYKNHFTSWQRAGRLIEAEYIKQSPLLAEALPLAKDLSEISDIGREAVEYLSTGTVATDEWRRTKLQLLERAAQPKAAVELVVIQPIRELVIAAAEQEKRKTLSATEWKKMIKDMAAPKKP
jgi:hexosaminidase